MKIHFTLEFDDALFLAKLTAAKPERPRSPTVAIAAVPEPPIPAEPPPDLPPTKSRNPGSGPQFNPAWLALVRLAKEPFTRRQLAVESGLNVAEVTLRLNRMKHHGWIEQPCPGLWRKTKTYGVK